MGDVNQLTFIRQYQSQIQGPVLEIGSKDYGNTQNLRAMLPKDYLGIDVEPGEGVDKVLDLTTNVNVAQEKLDGRRFRTIICLSVLEHCRDPFKMGFNVGQLTESGGLLFVSAPFTWRIHGYPDDYWRFTPAGIKIIFPDFDFDQYPWLLSTSKQGEIVPYADDMFRIELWIKKV